MTSSVPVATVAGRSPCAIVGERRLAPRVAADGVVELRCLGLPGPLRAALRDIGTGGLCAQTTGPFALGSLREIVLVLPGGSIVCEAEGLWQRGHIGESGMLSGVRFRQLPAADRAKLDRFVQDQAIRLAEFLGECPDLSDLGLDDAFDLAFRTRSLELRCGSVVYAQGTAGTRGDSVFIVRRGSVVLEATGAGARRVPVQRLETGGIFAGMPFLTGSAHTESALVERDVSLLEIDPFSFTHMLETKPGVAHGVLRGLLRARATQIESLIGRLAHG